MRRKLIGFGVLAGLLCVAFYTLRAENELPDLALQSLHLIKKPVEDLLPDLQDDANAQAVEQASLDIDPYQELHDDRLRWNEMRGLIETGQSLTSPLPSEIAVSTSPIGRLAPAIPPPPGFTVQLPYESRLTVSGRKTIGMIFRNTQFSNSSFATTQGIPTSQSSFELQQSLQVRINGQIGRKVTVNVDFDDTKTDKKDISIIYKGDPDEVVQKAAFGDINLSLPQTEFAGYSKQVFGASAEVKYKALKGYFIGSRTKGETETKEFVGNVILQRLTIPDTGYVRRRFYNYLSLTGAAADRGIALTSLKVYLDTQDSTRQGPQFSTMTVDLSRIPSPPAGSSTTYTGRFLLLAQGVDYTVDPSSGVITFKNALTNISVVAIDYLEPGTNQLISTDPGRGPTTPPPPNPPNPVTGCPSSVPCVPGMPRAIKWDESQLSQIPATEELTHYSLGSTKIVRDNGQGNFTLLLRNLGNNNIGSTVGIQYLPNNSGQIFVDFEAGTFVLTRRLDAPNAGGADFAPAYFFTPTTKSSFFVEFRARVKTYTLRPNIVLNSEHITMDGRTLVRDVDYFIDYASGFITFFNEDQITETTHILATYDFSPFGIAGAQQDTLVGTRAELSLSPIAPILASSLIGSSILYDFAPKQTAAPDIRQTTGSWLVEESDVHLKDLIFNPLPMLKSSFTGEVARSVRNPNTFGKALIDNMEGIQDETSVSLSKINWLVAATPSDVLAPGSPGSQFLNAMGQVNLVNQPGDNLTNNLVRTLDINPNAAALSGDQTQILTINYNLSLSTEAAIAAVLGPGGVDFSRKLFLDMYVQGDGTAAGGPALASQTQINVTLGQVSEDFDNSHLFKTEDANHNNTLDINEDIGIPFQNPDGTTVTLGAGNLRIDSNDLDRNGVLDLENTNVGGNLGYVSGLPNHINPITFDPTLPGDPSNRVDFTGWRFVRVPLNISTATAANWSAIKEIRIALKPGPGAVKSGIINIAKISVVGNKWQADAPTVFAATISSITAKAINTEDDVTYVPPTGIPDFDDLNQVNTALTGPTPTKRREQSLALDYLLQATTGPVTLSAQSVTVAPMDLTPYGSLKFFVRKTAASTNGQGARFIFRAGSDTDYFQFALPIDGNLQPDVWNELTINQIGGSRPNDWSSGVVGSSITRVGNPNLTSVAQLRFGIDSPNPTGVIGTVSGEIWVDELFGADVITRTGIASLVKSDFEVYGWGSFGVGARNIDRNFETFTSAVSNQDRHEQNAYLNLTRMTWFPMKFTGLDRHTITPAINTVNSTLVSIQQEGDVRERALTGAGTLQIPRFPKIGLTYDTDKITSAQLFRTDNANNYGMTMDYAPPVQRFFMPRSIQLGYKLSKLKLNFADGALAAASDPFSVSNTRDDTQEINAKLSFQPLPGFSFNPNFSRSTTKESKDVLFSTSTSVAASTQTLDYDKLRSQTMGFDSVLGIKRWFSPRLRYTITNRETYGIPLAITPAAAGSKTVDRTSTGEAAWDFAWHDFTTRLRPLQSMNVVSNYLMEDGDSTQNVDGGFDSLKSFTIRKGIGSGQRTNLTLRDTFRSTQRLSPFDWATNWKGSAQPLKTMSLTSTYTNTKQRQETTDTPTKITTQIFPDLVIGLTQTEYFFHAQRFMSNSQMNLKTQYKSVDTVGTTLEKSSTNGGDWRMTLVRKLDLFVTYTRTTDNLFDRINNVTTSDSKGEVLGAQLGFNVGKWRFTPKYDQTKQQTVDASGRLTADLTSRIPALQVYADLFLPAGLRLPFGDLVVFSNRVRTTNTISLEQKRSSLDELNANTDTYKFTTSNDYEMTANIRLTVGGSYFYLSNKVSSDANSSGYEFNSLLTIQF